MSTLSVPLSPELESTIINLVKKGYASNKAGVVRKALQKVAEEEAINAVLQSEKEVSEGKMLHGNAGDLINLLP